MRMASPGPRPWLRKLAFFWCQERPRNRFTHKPPAAPSSRAGRPTAFTNVPRVVEDILGQLLPVLPDSILQSAYPMIFPAGNVRPALEELRDDGSVPSLRCGHKRSHAAAVGLVEQLRRSVEERSKLVDLTKLHRLTVPPTDGCTFGKGHSPIMLSARFRSQRRKASSRSGRRRPPNERCSTPSFWRLRSRRVHRSTSDLGGKYTPYSTWQ